MAAKASSRLGPTLPLAPAAPSVWQLAHLEVKSVFPFCVFPPAATPPVPQPEARSAMQARAASGSRTPRHRLRCRRQDARVSRASV